MLSVDAHPSQANASARKTIAVQLLIVQLKFYGGNGMALQQKIVTFTS
jgi:hypothetical protein